MERAVRRRATLLVALALVAVALLLPLPSAQAAPQERTLTIQARQFAYEPGVVRVNRGDTVTIHLESMDAVHGLFVDGYEVNLDAEPGRSALATFVASRAGSFKMRCSVACGALHPFMIGELVVEPNLPLVRAILLMLAAAFGSVLYFWKV